MIFRSSDGRSAVELFFWTATNSSSSSFSTETAPSPQNELMHLLRDRYIGKLVDNSKLDKTKWEELEKKTTWFSANKALNWGLVDRIE